MGPTTIKSVLGALSKAMPDPTRTQTGSIPDRSYNGRVKKITVVIECSNQHILEQLFHLQFTLAREKTTKIVELTATTFLMLDKSFLPL